MKAARASKLGLISYDYVTNNHLLFGRRLNLQVIGSKEEETIDICSRYKHIQNLIEHYIKRWENEYLIELREFHKTKSNGKDKQANQTLNVGDVVLIHEKNASKMNFKLGTIDSFKPSRDGAIRIANVHYVINSKTVHVRRPNHKTQICKVVTHVETWKKYY